MGGGPPYTHAYAPSGASLPAFEPYPDISDEDTAMERLLMSIT